MKSGIKSGLGAIGLSLALVSGCVEYPNNHNSNKLYNNEIKDALVGQDNKVSDSIIESIYYNENSSYKIENITSGDSIESGGREDIYILTDQNFDERFNEPIIIHRSDRNRSIGDKILESIITEKDNINKRYLITNDVKNNIIQSVEELSPKDIQYIYQQKGMIPEKSMGNTSNTETIKAKSSAKENSKKDSIEENDDETFNALWRTVFVPAMNSN